MKNLIFSSIILLSFLAQAQIYKPVKWTTSVEKISSKEYNLVATATIEKDWHIYSQNVAEGGPSATLFSFDSTKDYLKKGITKEENGHTINDPIFKMEVTYFADKAVFKQRIVAKTIKAFKVTGTVEFMVCNDTQCLPPTEVDLQFDVK